MEGKGGAQSLERGRRGRDERDRGWRKIEEEEDNLGPRGLKEPRVTRDFIDGQ